MFLTRFTINGSRLAVGWISNRYRVHQRLRMAYPEEERLLYRIEESQDHITILVQSNTEPVWQKAFDDFSVLLEAPQTKMFSPLLGKGGVYRFRLVANPTVTQAGKRQGLLREEDQLDWMKRQIDKSGAVLLECRVRKIGLERSSKNPFKDPHVQTHLAVQFDGVIRVEDTDRLIEAIRLGIGPAKAYGFGLLSLAPFSR